MQKVSFSAKGEFYSELRKRVDSYFSEKGLKHTGNWQMYLKSTIIITLFLVSYISLVFFSNSIVMGLISAFFLAQSFVLIGFNIMHDGNHGSYSKNKTINRIMGYTMDFLGSSHTLWKQKHNILHHTYTNIDGMDEDLETSGFLRLSPNQKWKPKYRLQHFYGIIIYSFLTLSLIFAGDFKKIWTGKIGKQKIKKVKFTEQLFFYGFKLIYFGYVIILPLFFHSFFYVLFFFLLIHFILGLTLALVFQLAHTVEPNAFPVPEKQTGNIENEWAIHQVETTANFALQNKLAAWYLGGLNFQIEHHLFTNVCHIHYPEISKIVQQTSREFSINYTTYPTLISAIGAHFKFLKRLGMKPQPVLS
ncbi:fatty acid desaturase family protein [Calditrichota bacterium]